MAAIHPVYLRRRKVGASATTYSYDAENRLTSVSGAATATFVYDGRACPERSRRGNRVKATFGSTTTVYPSTVLRAGVGNTFERDNGSTVKKYYYAGGVRVAMRTGGQTYYLLGDHLGGTNVTANSSGVQISKLLYRPWGETRFSTGTTPTTWRFTGQREDATIGLYFYNARYLDPQLGRFTQPDTIVPDPGNPQALNRYSYVGNRPTMLVDPSGHCSTPSVDGSIGCTGVTGGLTVPLIIDPATQPLTVAATGPQDTQRAEMRAARTAADDGVFLMYQIPGYANGRAEVVIVNAGVPDNPLVNGGVEVRRVWSGNESYEETAVNGGIGLFGAEWSSRKGETVPSIGTNIAGVGVQLQPGQLMAGVVNPMGPGGVRAGAEWRVESSQTFITTRAFLKSTGGVSEFGTRFAGPDAKLLRLAYQGRMGNMSGIEVLRLVLYGYEFPYEEQP